MATNTLLNDEGVSHLILHILLFRNVNVSIYHSLKFETKPAVADQKNFSPRSCDLPNSMGALDGPQFAYSDLLQELLMALVGFPGDVFVLDEDINR